MSNFFCAPDGKLNYKRTILTGFGFLATSIAWAIYDPYITKILNALLNGSATVSQWSAKLVEKMPFLTDLAAAQGEDVALAGGGFTLVPLFIGIIMTFDNIFGVIFQPTFGKLSDDCHSKLGKRRPFIVFGAPVSAALFAAIPIIFIKTGNLPLTMTFIILFVFVMSLWRAPVVALMPDLTPPALRSEGNAVINLMGGLGGAIGMVAGTIAIALCGIFTGMTGEQIKANETVSFPYVFAIGSVVMILGMLVVLFFVKEQDTSIKLTGEKNQYLDAAARKKAENEAKKAEKAAKRAITLSKAERKSLGFMLVCLFFLFCGTNAITTFFSLFAQEILHKITSEATILMLIFAVISALAALPAGKMGKKFGRKKTIASGLGVFLSAFVVFFAIFIVMLGKQGLGISEYVTVNNAYITVNDQLNNFNADVSDDVKALEKSLEYDKKADAAFEETINSFAADEILDVTTYIKYSNALDGIKADKIIDAAKYDAYKAALASHADDCDAVYIDKISSLTEADILDMNTCFTYGKALEGLKSREVIDSKTYKEYKALLSEHENDYFVDMNEYIQYRQALDNGGSLAAFSPVYADFDAALDAYSQQSIDTAVANGADRAGLKGVSESVKGVSVNTLGKDAAITFGDALAAIRDAVAGVTKILGILIYPVLILGGAANMFITVNTLPLVLEIGGLEKVGTFTGYYYTATFSAQIASPILYGFIRMFAGTYMSLFYYSPVAFLLAILALMFVKHGEAIPEDVIKAAKESGDD